MNTLIVLGAVIRVSSVGSCRLLAFLPAVTRDTDSIDEPLSVRTDLSLPFTVVTDLRRTTVLRIYYGHLVLLTRNGLGVSSIAGRWRERGCLLLADQTDKVEDVTLGTGSLLPTSVDTDCVDGRIRLQRLWGED